MANSASADVGEDEKVEFGVVYSAFGLLLPIVYYMLISHAFTVVPTPMFYTICRILTTLSLSLL